MSSKNVKKAKGSINFRPNWHKLFREEEKKRRNSKEHIIFELRQNRIERNNCLDRIKYLDRDIERMEEKLLYTE